MLGRQILIENPSLYLRLDGHDYAETEFLGELVKRTGCGLLIDVNNVFVSASNLGFSPLLYLDALPSRGDRRNPSRRPQPGPGPWATHC